MSGVSAGDVLFIVLIGGLIWGLLWLANRGRSRKKDQDSSPPS